MRGFSKVVVAGVGARADARLLVWFVLWAGVLLPLGVC